MKSGHVWFSCPSSVRQREIRVWCRVPSGSSGPTGRSARGIPPCEVPAGNVESTAPRSRFTPFSMLRISFVSTVLAQIRSLSAYAVQVAYVAGGPFSKMSWPASRRTGRAFCCCSPFPSNRGRRKSRGAVIWRWRWFRLVSLAPRRGLVASELGGVQMPECSMKLPAVQLNAGQSHTLTVPRLKRFGPADRKRRSPS